MQVCFVNSEKAPISTKRIGFYTTTNGESICLFEIVSETYPHPDAPDDAVIQCLNTRLVDIEKIGSEKAAALYLHHHATINCENFLKTIGK